MPTVAVLGLGEAGSRLAGDLLEAGAEVRAFDPEGRDVDGVVRAPDPQAAVAGADVVLSVNSAAAALGAATAALPALSQGSVYADLNTAAPELKREIAVLVEGAGARFADVALLGAVPATGIRTPALASGAGARAFADAFVPLGMPVEVVSELPGDAATLKLLRSVFMKGIAAAAIESLEAAEAAGRRELARGAACRGSRRAACSNAWSRAAAGTRRAGWTRWRRRATCCSPSGSSRASRRRAPPCSPRWRPLRSPAGDKVAPMVTQPAEEVRPSERARVLVRGAYDLHVHIGARRAAAADRRPVARPPLRRAGSRRLRAQVALHVHGRAGPGRLGGRP